MALLELPAWKALSEHWLDVRDVHMRDLFDADPARFEKFSVKFNDILLDFSKNRITQETVDLLAELARESELEKWIEKMFSGKSINHTEKRAALHTALRNRKDRAIKVDGQDVMPAIYQALDKMQFISDTVRNGEWQGFSGRNIIDVVNLGVGGSDLGPVMVTEALHPYGKSGLRVHFVSNVDPSHICDTLRNLNPETTLFIVSSKSFTTQDTIANAKTARDWLLETARDDTAVQKHFIAVAANTEAAVEFGIAEENILEMWDWVGGRYSLWSSIGISIAIYIGMDRFKALLEGAFEMDEHFRTAPFEKNIPVIMAMLGIWYNNFFDADTYAVLPYDQHLHRFPAFLQQVDMESNGKSVTRSGKPTDYSTGPILWGELGITGQHAFYQSLHQGTKLVPTDFIVPIESLNPVGQHHTILLANFFAQTQALTRGRTEEEAITELQAEGMSEEDINRLSPYKVFKGNKPSNTILFRALTPRTLGSLIAMYEHKIFVQGVIWEINSFDQWGVELGKQLADTIFKQLCERKPVSNHDVSTNGLINYYMKMSGG
ncbi:Glucose-6-phosphate isomerase [hydrothermal vent metagenome]|uniref:glucose-6-phosphate isomerase n=1 Tax=hydrothermal vent metagenome TaxID=652676 RepID=A0A3B1AKV4_9ZZZZ